MRSPKHFWPIPLTALALVAAMLCAPTASAQTAAATASAKRIADICGKRAKRATRGVATVSRLSAKKRRQAAWRRCVLRLRRTGADHPGRGKRDTTAPIVVWTSPATGSIVSGQLAGAGCEAQASDDRGVARVVFRVDNASLNTEVAAPYNCSIDTSAVADGSHTLTATAYDAAGNSSIASTTIVVANEPVPEPSPAPEPDPDPVPEPTPEPEPSPDPVPEPIPVPVPAPAPEPEARSLTIAIDGGHDEWWEDTIEARAALGAAVTRHEWDPAEPVDSREGLVLAAATEVHTRIHALLGGNELGDPTHYRDWVVAFVRRYGRDGSFWDAHPTLDESRYAITSIELGNEPYFGAMSATEYADAVQPTLERIAELGLPVKVILPSYIHGQNTAWIDTLYQRISNLNSLFYGFADHPYWYGHHPADTGDNGPFARIQTLRQRMNHHGAASKPIFLTEYGESTASCGTQCVSEATQAEHLKAMLDAVVSRTEWKIEMLSFFQLHDWATNSSDREKQFGLLRQNGTQKPSYSIIRSAMQQYRG